MPIALGLNVYGVFTATISLVALIGHVLHRYLPSARMKILVEALDDTEGMIYSMAEAGLLPRSRAVLEMEERLAILRAKSSELHAKAVCATTPWKECKELCKGLSASIGICLCQVKELRASAVMISEAERRRLREQSLNGSVSKASAPSHLRSSESGSRPIKIIVPA
ncbi:hypothetical protein SERLA73DRAFT_164257 [Serpula lacrymans var. lacrymans S7.3]|uniref:Uncharacterized protein n=2 Tax=Serpula lacrymans var. lacrymans TaxID=341189 RepID=F8QI43_SERL3|nr:uncharacterized protein SERLADRAFT_414187 [Serpula lacrymans var. lacrymans S7.9]EGN92054.1 hypothetical protein SERLA73DRAFT_164257 [Serpula lacrymans var. lacrymans S7.3]EGO27999.1 hypothetical protein SERLADRAFT_414187 [Serpula lacrymans var. lacrymans S7.9]